METIEVDVIRSFNNLKEIPQDTLKKILKTYAIVNPDLNYCQGMNFIAGFLYLAMDKQEALAFAVMREIIERYAMSNLFNTELPMLKLMFYQLDRLISINLPDLHNHFKVSSLFLYLFRMKLSIQATSVHPFSLLFLPLLCKPKPLLIIHGSCKGCGITT